VWVNNLQYVILDKQCIQNDASQVFIAFLETVQKIKNKNKNSEKNCFVKGLRFKIRHIQLATCCHMLDSGTPTLKKN